MLILTEIILLAMLLKTPFFAINVSLFLLIFTNLLPVDGLKAQSLSADIKIIEQTNDLMGGIVSAKQIWLEIYQLVIQHSFE